MGFKQGRGGHWLKRPTPSTTLPSVSRTCTLPSSALSHAWRRSFASSVAWPRTSLPPPSLDWSSPSSPPSTPTCTRPSRTARTATRSSAKQLILPTTLLITFATNRGLDINGTRNLITTAMEKWGGHQHPSPAPLLLLHQTDLWT